MRATTILARIMLFAGLLCTPLIAGDAQKPVNPGQPGQPDNGWIFEDLSITEGQYDLALSSDGYGRVFINPDGNHPIWLEQIETGWDQAIFDQLPTGGYGSSGSVALDPDDLAHAVYPCQDQGNNSTCYIVQDAIGWNTQFTGVESSTAPYSLVLDSHGNPHYGYNIRTSYVPPVSSVNYAHLTDTGWITQTIETGVDLESENKIDLDLDDNPHVIYVDRGTENYLKYAVWNGSSWQITEDFTPDGKGYGSDLVLDNQGHPHISWQYGDIYYSHFDGTNWHSQLVEDGDSIGLLTSIDLAPGDQPLISYFADGDLRLARLESGAWVTETVETVWLDPYKPLILKIDEVGGAHILYSRMYSGLRHAYQPIYVPIEGLTAAVNGQSLLRKPTQFSSEVSVGTYISYEWNFGDGATGLGKNVSHTYMDSGEYEVTVNAQNPVSSGIYTFTLNVLPYTDVYLPMIREDDVKLVYPYSGLCASYDPGVEGWEAHITWCVPKVWLRWTGEMQVFTTWTLEVTSGPSPSCLTKHSDDTNTNMYLTDNSLGRYDHTLTGGAAHGESYICNHETIEGWFLFPAGNPGEKDFTFNDDDQDVLISGIHVAP